MLLTLIARPAAEERVVDWLLDREDLTGFTSEKAYGHSREHGGFDLVEQVTGRQRRALFRVQLSAEEAESLIAAMREELKGASLRYWLTPIHDAGVIE